MIRAATGSWSASAISVLVVGLWSFGLEHDLVEDEFTIA